LRFKVPFLSRTTFSDWFSDVFSMCLSVFAAYLFRRCLRHVFELLSVFCVYRQSRLDPPNATCMRKGVIALILGRVHADKYCDMHIYAQSWDAT
jgi:hypothetical protein